MSGTNVEDLRMREICEYLPSIISLQPGWERERARDWDTREKKAPYSVCTSRKMFVNKVNEDTSRRLMS